MLICGIILGVFSLIVFGVTVHFLLWCRRNDESIFPMLLIGGIPFFTLATTSVLLIVFNFTVDVATPTCSCCNVRF